MTKKIFAIVLLVSVVAQSAFAKGAYCPSDLLQNQPSQRASAFLRLDKMVYSLAGSMTIDAGVMNTGDSPIYVYDWLSWGPGGGLVILLRDERSKLIAPIVRDDTMLPPPREGNNQSMFVRLRDSGDFFGTQRNIELRDLVKSPGKYTLQIEYRSPLSCKFVDGKLKKLPALWHEDAGIFSKQVPFEVTAGTESSSHDRSR
jgi:hypothetical protein